VDAEEPRNGRGRETVASGEEKTGKGLNTEATKEEAQRTQRRIESLVWFFAFVVIEVLGDLLGAILVIMHRA